MNIIEAKKINGDLTKVEQYKAVECVELSAKDVADDVIMNVTGYVIFEDTNKTTGNDVELLSLLTDIGVVATQSKTFKDKFLDIWNMFCEDMEEIPIKKISGTTKAGRPFVSCTLGM